jgi:hypothetical protein
MTVTARACLWVTLCAAASSAGDAAAPRALEITAGGRVTWRAPIAAGERFAVSFMHSQERTRWTQHYVAVNDGRIRQVASTFGSYGAGMPLGEVTRSPAGFTAHTDRRFSSIPMMNSRAAQLTLRYRDHTFAIDRWFADYERFEIRVR